MVKALNNVVSEIIRWPTGLKLAASKERFIRFGDAHMPGVIGAIDGCYIFIKNTKF